MLEEELRLKKGSAQYRLDKSKAGRCGSSAGQPRPYARQNVLKARLFSPVFIGKSLTVSPKHPYLRFKPGNYYKWSIVEAGVGYIEDVEVEAQEISEHFIVKTKGSKNYHKGGEQ